MTYIVRVPFEARSGEIKKGQIIAMPENKAQALVTAGKITELKSCHICGDFAWWLSIYGALRCGTCHPPASAELVKRWIGDGDRLTTMKMALRGRHNEIL
jgi:hypothetical protein